MDEESKNKGSDASDLASATVIIADWRPSFELSPGEAPESLFEVIGGPMDGSRRRVVQQTITIGRGKENDLTLPLDQMISTCHARITREGGHYWLEDLDSSNGTFLGDKRIQERVLIGPGTIFLVGQTYVEFMPH